MGEGLVRLRARLRRVSSDFPEISGIHVEFLQNDFRIHLATTLQLKFLTGSQIDHDLGIVLKADADPLSPRPLLENHCFARRDVH